MKYVHFFILLTLSSLAFAQEPKDTIDIDDIDIDDIKDDEYVTTSTFPWEDFSVGGQLSSLQFGDVTRIGAAPEIVYKVDNRISVGIGGLFDYTKFNRIWNGFQFVDADYSSFNTAGRLFTRVTPVPSFPVFIQAEYENAKLDTPYDFEFQGNSIQYFNVDQKVNNYSLGAGFNNGPGYIALIYNMSTRANRDEFKDLVNEDLINRGFAPVNVSDNLYPYQGLNFRAGFLIPLSSGNKNRRIKKKRKEQQPKEDSE